MKKILLIISLLFVFPITIFAAGDVTVSKSSITLENGESASFEIKATNSAGKVTISSSNTSIVTVDNSSEWLDNSSLKVTAKATGVGEAKITVIIDAATYDMDVVKKTHTITVKVNPPKSSNNNLSDLSVNGKKVDGFSSSKTSYTLSNTDDTKLTIDASVEDSKAKVSGTGEKSIKYGKNTFDVVVTAENGSKKTYKIVVTRNDNRSSNNFLSSLSVSNLDLTFNKNTTNYSLTAEHSLNSVEINALVEDSKAKVSGTGNKTLKDGKNTFSIVVTAENETKKTYTIVINRKNAKGSVGDLSSNNSIKDLSINGYEIFFNTNVDKYYVEVANEINSLDIEVTLSDTKATYEILGNSNFDKNINEVTIKVMSEDGKEKNYKVIVLKKDLVVDNKKEIEDKNESEEVSTNESKFNYFLVISIIEFLFIIGYILFTKSKSNKAVATEPTVNQ